MPSREIKGQNGRDSRVCLLCALLDLEDMIQPFTSKFENKKARYTQCFEATWTDGQCLMEKSATVQDQ